MASLQLVEQDASGGTWRPVPSTYGTDPSFVTARIDHGGTFALVGAG